MVYNEERFSVLYKELSESKRATLSGILNDMNQGAKMDDLKLFLEFALKEYKPQVLDLQKETTSAQNPRLAYLEGVVNTLEAVQDFLEGKKS